METNQLIKFLMDRNIQQSREFCDFALSRRQYRAIHPTEICALKCMDGRLNLSVMTKTPPGIIQPYRNIGGKFDLGWPYFGTLIRKWVEYSMSRGRDCIILATYHFSKGDHHRGCAGFGYDTEAAKASNLQLIEDLEEMFGKKHYTVYPIQVGIETDEEALILHDKNGKILDLSNKNYTEEELVSIIREMFPDMKNTMIRDLIPLLTGNQEHSRSVLASGRPIEDFDHKEQILAIGRGFDWLHLPNKALIIGPYSFDLGEPIATAAGLLLKNINLGRVPKDEGVVLMTSAVYSNKADVEYKQAIAKARSFARFALKVIEEKVPKLLEHLHTEPLVGIVDLNTRKMTRINFSEKNQKSNIIKVSDSIEVAN